MLERRHSTCSVVVNVEDINDNSPVFISRSNISIAEDEAIGYPIVLVAATDEDKNNSIRYTITSGDPQNRFHLNVNSGKCFGWHFVSSLPKSVYFQEFFLMSDLCC